MGNLKSRQVDNINHYNVYVTSVELFLLVLYWAEKRAILYSIEILAVCIKNPWIYHPPFLINSSVSNDQQKSGWRKVPSISGYVSPD